MTNSPNPRAWEDDIPGCFGDIDRFFAIHPLDEQRAKALLKRARSENVRYNQLMGAMVAFMLSEGCTTEHIDEQSRRISKMFKGKISD